MVRNMASEMADPQVGYTDEMFILGEDLRVHTKFIVTLVHMKLMSVRQAQVINSNFGYLQFEKIRNGEV